MTICLNDLIGLVLTLIILIVVVRLFRTDT